MQRRVRSTGSESLLSALHPAACVPIFLDVLTALHVVLLVSVLTVLACRHDHVCVSHLCARWSCFAGSF